MTMSVIWFVMCVAAVGCAVFFQTDAAIGAAALTGAQEGVRLGLSLAGSICLWSGISRAMEQTGLAQALARLLRPLLSRLFPESSRDTQALSAISGNFTANLLGLGNAATPLGVAAVRRMLALSGGGAASNEMCRLIVLNTASIQLIPATVGALRASLGAAAPFDILPAVWLSSLVSVMAGLAAARLMEGRHV